MAKPVMLLGYGYWGEKLARAIGNHPHFYLSDVVEPDKEKRESAAALYDCNAAEDLDCVTIVPQIAVIAVPASGHKEAIRRCMKLGVRNILCEKPLALSLREATAISCTVEDVGGMLMVDHVFCFTAGAQAIAQHLSNVSPQDVLTYSSIRENLGIFRTDCNVIWDLAVHDFALLQYFFPAFRPTQVRAIGSQFYGNRTEAVDIFVTLRSRDDSSACSQGVAHIRADWISPEKKRLVTIKCRNEEITWDAAAGDEFCVTPCRVNVQQTEHGVEISSTEVDGSVTTATDGKEPLTAVLDEFYRSIIGGVAPGYASDISAAVRAIQLAECAEKSLALGGDPVTVSSW